MGRSYLAQGGSTVRIDWKSEAPDRYTMYFIWRTASPPPRNTSLVNTFKELHGDVFTFEGNRAILFGEADDLPVDELKHRIALPLRYHQVKRPPLADALPLRSDLQLAMLSETTAPG